MKTIKKIFLLTLFLLLGLNYITTQALDLYTNEAPKDTDLDGLTDQGEIQIFFTDPNNPDSDQDGFLDGTEILVKSNPLDLQSPLKTNAPNIASKNTPWSWYIARIAGITSYLMLFLLILSGIGITTGYILNLFGPVIAWRIHRTIGISLFFFIITHIIALYLDDFMNFSLTEILVPFVSNFKPLYLSLGIIGFYLFLIILFTSIILIVKKYKFWKIVHYLTYPTFIFLFIHGVFIGTDTQTLPMQIIYGSTGLIVLSIFIYRLVKIPSLLSKPQSKTTN